MPNIQLFLLFYALSISQCVIIDARENGNEKAYYGAISQVFALLFFILLDKRIRDAPYSHVMLCLLLGSTFFLIDYKNHKKSR